MNQRGQLTRQQAGWEFKLIGESLTRDTGHSKDVDVQ